MQIPVLNGVYTDENADFRISYPHNLIPVPVKQGISNGYLRPAEGIVAFGDEGPGVGRGGINWNGVCYRVMGSKLVRVLTNGTIVEIGDIAGTGTVTMDYSFDYLSISGGGNLYLYDGVTLQQVTDPDLGVSLDHIWVDGFFMSTDGEFLIVTELNDPFTVLTTKYGSSEVDPDPIKAILKLRNEPYALNRYTIEVFDNIGGLGFPFQRVDGAQIQRGVVGTHACCIFMEAVAFVGSGRNEAIAVWLGANGSSVKISNREIEQRLNQYSEATLAEIIVEEKIDQGHQQLLIHLPDQTLVYDAAASQVVGQVVWFTLGSGIQNPSPYRARHLVRCYDKWLVSDTMSNALGELVDNISSHWGELVSWEFGTLVIYNGSRGALFHELELVALSGRVALGDTPKIWTEYSLDGETWSQRHYINAGRRGERNKRLVWFGQGSMQNWRVQRFGGTSDAHVAVARLEAQLEPLVV